jgi:hypothetical protein
MYKNHTSKYLKKTITECLKNNMKIKTNFEELRSKIHKRL